MELIFGFAEILDVAEVMKDGVGLNRAISIAYALDPAAVASIKEEPSKAYANECIFASMYLNSLSSQLIEYLEGLGYAAVSLEDPLLEINAFFDLGEGDSGEDIKTLDALDVNPKSIVHAMHRIFAAHAGLGWIGKSGLIVAKHYGSAVMLATIFTNAPLDCATEVFLSRCSRCKECADACPIGAIKISEQTSTNVIDSLFDTDSYEEGHHKQRFRQFCGKSDVCGLCIYACPYTQSYLRRKGFSYE